MKYYEIIKQFSYTVFLICDLLFRACLLSSLLKNIILISNLKASQLWKMSYYKPDKEPSHNDRTVSQRETHFLMDI